MTRSLSEAERRAWLRLARTQNVGPVTFAQLIARFGSATTSLAELPHLSRRGGGEPLQPPSDADAREEIEASQDWRPSDRVCRAGVSARPRRARSAAAHHLRPRPRHTVQPRDDRNGRRARNASALGRKLAGTLAKDLGEAGFVVVSGLARGIDTAAHEGSLASGTCAVIAGGIDVIYPPENANLYERIRAQGTIVSEMPLGQTPQARHFQRRNRLISGMSRGVIAVEAAEGSGSLITANYALEQNREIFAVPGSPLDPRAKGTNRLIREGATLIETAEDVIAVVRPILVGNFREPENGSSSAQSDGTTVEAEVDRIRTLVEEALGPAPVDVDELIRLCKAPAAAVLTVLLELELAGRLARNAGNRVSWA